MATNNYARPEALVDADWVSKHSKDNDVRIIESNEDILLYDTGHIPGAQPMFLPKLREKSAALDKSKPTAVYCASGYRASLGASILKQEGFTKVANIPGS